MAKRAMTEEAKMAKANRILDEAAEMLLTMNYENIKMADLAKRLGISNGILYVYFKTKETLFLCLLWREYEKRLDYLEEKTEGRDISNFEDIKQLFMIELEDLIDHNPLYIRLESLRAPIFERNTDEEILLKMKKHLFERMETWTERISASGVLSKSQLVSIFYMEVAILIGCKLETDIPENVDRVLNQIGAVGTRRDFESDVMTGMRCYLDGYGHQLGTE